MAGRGGVLRSFLAARAEGGTGDGQSISGAAWQARIFDTTKAQAIPAGRAFEAIYRAFLGRTNGPRAGWLLASLEPEFVVGRLREAAGAGETVEVSRRAFAASASATSL